MKPKTTNVKMLMYGGLLLAGVALHAAESVVVPAAAVSGAPKSCQISNVKYGDLLRPRNASGAEGAPVVLYPQQPWKCMTWKLHPAGDSRFQLQNHFTSKTFTAVTNCSEIVVQQVAWSTDGDKRPVWQITKLADGVFQITDAATQLALTAEDSGNGVRVTLAPWKNTEAQKWRVTEIDPARLTM